MYERFVLAVQVTHEVLGALGQTEQGLNADDFAGRGGHGLVFLRQHIEVVLGNAFGNSVLIHFGKQPINLCLALLSFCKLRCVFLHGSGSFLVSSLQDAL